MTDTTLPRKVPRLACTTEDPAAGFYRYTLPARGLTRLGLAQADAIKVMTCDYQSWRHGRRPWPDVFVAHRCKTPYLQAPYAELGRRGALLVFNDDDDMYSLSVGEYKSWGGASLDGLAIAGAQHDDTRPLFKAAADGMEAYVRKGWPGRSRLRAAFPGDAWRTQARVRIAGLPENRHLKANGIDDPQAAIHLQVEMLGCIVEAGTRDEALRRIRALAPAHCYRRLIAAAHVLTVSTPELARRYHDFNPFICVIPNAIDLESACYQQASRLRSERGAPDMVTVGWSGSFTHLADFRVAASALARLFTEYDGTNGRPMLRIMVGGDARVWKSLAHLPGCEAFRRQIGVASGTDPFRLAETGYKTFTSSCGRFVYKTGTRDVESVARMYEDIDIGIVPLVVGTPINHCKSDLKGLEMGGMCVPCIASPIPSYVEWRGKEGTGCIVVNDNSLREWTAALRTLIDDAALRRQMSEEARKFAETRSIDRWAPKWAEVFEEAVKGRKALPCAAARD